MKRLITLSLICLTSFLCKSGYSQQFWQTVTQPSTTDISAHFKTPSSVYSHAVTWGWSGKIDREAIGRNLDSISAHGLKIATIEAGYNMPGPYLSPQWFELVKIAVEEAKKRDMRLWIIDEGKYPSGFAGGKFSQEKPELRMQGLVVATKFAANGGETINRQLSQSIISAIAINQADRSNRIIPLKSGGITWNVPNGSWEILLIEHRFKTSVTRAANNPIHGKDTVNSLCDYLNPLATKQFLEFTHVQYKKYIGEEFGKTVLGFRGDEPDYGFTPWTPKLPEEFLKRKGYNIVPDLGVIFAKELTTEQKRKKADYWDVWSDLFRENFFDIQADWCSANHMEYMVHLNHEEKMMELVKSEGDFFKDMRHVGIPGVDAIWLQIWPDKVADYPKLASSAAHMYGRPRALSESFAAYTIPPSVPQAKWVIDYQMVRGINLFEYMFWSFSDHAPKGYLGSQEFIPIAKYSNRAAYLLANGIPAAQVGIYQPTGNLWLGDEEANKSTLNIAQDLSEHQIDYDFVDDQGLATVFTIDKGGFTNLSGQNYKAIIIPRISYIPKNVLDRLKKFSELGGQVIFIGNYPEFTSGVTYLNAQKTAVVKWGHLVPTNKLSPENYKLFLPKPDVILGDQFTGVKYLHRRWKDADLYFLFNESDTFVQTQAIFAGHGEVQLWDAINGDISPVKSKKISPAELNLLLDLKAHETKFIVIKH